MFTTHTKRFDKRFEAFRALSYPPSLSYDDYVKGSDFSIVKSNDLLASATDCFRSAKDLIDWLLDVISLESQDKSIFDLAEKRQDDDLYISIRREEVLQLAKICVHNSLYLHKLKSVGNWAKASTENDARLEFNAHKQYCTLTVA